MYPFKIQMLYVLLAVNGLLIPKQIFSNMVINYVIKTHKTEKILFN